MLAEIAAANAAFKVIKTAISNGKELYDCSEAATKYFNNKSAIDKININFFMSTPLYNCFK